MGHIIFIPKLALHICMGDNYAHCLMMHFYDGVVHALNAQFERARAHSSPMGGLWVDAAIPQRDAQPVRFGSGAYCFMGITRSANDIFSSNRWMACALTILVYDSCSLFIATSTMILNDAGKLMITWELPMLNYPQCAVINNLTKNHSSLYGTGLNVNPLKKTRDSNQYLFTFRTWTLF